jgi:tRNA dimethylallyltransferase
VAMLVAGRVGAEILSVDSMQVYRGMDIGTAKPSVTDRQTVRHHMIDVADPEEEYSVARFQEEGRAALGEAAHRGARVLVVGGSGLHFRALVDPLEFPPSDPEVRAHLDALPAGEAVRRLLDADAAAGGHVDLANPRRVVRALEVLELSGTTPSERATSPLAEAVRAYRPLIPVVAVGIDPGPKLAARVRTRFEEMLTRGLVAEVRSLVSRMGRTAAAAVGYREMTHVVTGDWDEAYAARRAVEATTALARRQRTYHRRDPRLRWLEWDDDPAELADRAWRALEEAGWTS